MQNSTDPVNIFNIIKVKRQVNFVNNINSDRKDIPIFYINDDSNSDGNRKKTII